jgi:GalNAc-alpha-(1->4)-GalNAc-alpha-(1->3)-diNAcBac-PP-undecaprenol alpha-1,4-N-acetyl-D-galactosaminyltransferase
MRILCLLPQIGPGGAERVMVMLANSFSNTHEITLLTWAPRSEQSFYPISERIHFLQTGLIGGTLFRRNFNYLCRPFVLRRQIRRTKAEIVLSFLTTANLVAILACMGTNIPVVVSERIDPAMEQTTWSIRLARYLLYPFSAQLVVQTKKVADYFRNYRRLKIGIIPNPVARATIVARPEMSGLDGRFQIIAVGRLEYQKGFDLLLDAFMNLAPRHPAWDLVIFGEGSERSQLIHKIETNQLSHRVKLPGVSLTVTNELTGSNIFAMTSRYEGFPNALAEGLSFGLPAIGYRGVSGVDEMIIHGVNGLLIKPTAGTGGLERALDMLMSNPDLRRDFGSKATEISGRWAIEAILPDWEGVLLNSLRHTLVGHR